MTLVLSAQLQVVVSSCVWLSLSLSVSSQTTGGVKKEPTGDLGYIMQVCSCRLFTPHIAFLSIEAHNLTQVPAQEVELCQSPVPGVGLRGAPSPQAMEPYSQ